MPCPAPVTCAETLLSMPESAVTVPLQRWARSLGRRCWCARAGGRSLNPAISWGWINRPQGQTGRIAGGVRIVGQKWRVGRAGRDAVDSHPSGGNLGPDAFDQGVDGPLGRCIMRRGRIAAQRFRCDRPDRWIRSADGASPGSTACHALTVPSTCTASMRRHRSGVIRGEVGGLVVAGSGHQAVHRSQFGLQFGDGRDHGGSVGDIGDHSRIRLRGGSTIHHSNGRSGQPECGDARGSMPELPPVTTATATRQRYP